MITRSTGAPLGGRVKFCAGAALIFIAIGGNIAVADDGVALPYSQSYGASPDNSTEIPLRAVADSTGRPTSRKNIFNAYSKSYHDFQERHAGQPGYGRRGTHAHNYYRPRPMFSEASFVLYDETGKILDNQAPDLRRPIASLTKIMTAIIFLGEATPSAMEAKIKVSSEDAANAGWTHTKLFPGENIPAKTMLQIMMVASDNVAANALSRSLPGTSRDQFIAKMNARARELYMSQTSFTDPAGLNESNMSNTGDLQKMVSAFLKIKEASQYGELEQVVLYRAKKRPTVFTNTNRLIRNWGYHSLLSKTGHIDAAGYNLIFVQDNHCQGGGKKIFFILLGATSSMQRSRQAAEAIQSVCEKVFGGGASNSMIRQASIALPRTLKYHINSASNLSK